MGRLRSLSLISLFTIASLALSMQFAFAQSVNLIQNPSFETAGVGGVPANWAKNTWGTPAPTFTYPATGHTGNGATVAFSAASNGDARWQPDAVAVDAGATYTYSAWYTSNVASEIDTEFTNASGAISYGWVADVPSSANVWKQITAQFTIPSGITKVSIFQLIDKKGTLTVDDVSLTKNGGTGTTTPPAAPTLSLTASPQNISSGQSSALTWSTTNATGCTASNGWTGAKATSGTQAVSPAATTTYAMTCTGAGGNVTQQTVIGVTASSTTPPPAAPTLTFSASPTTVNAGATSTLTWSSTNAMSCTASNGWTGGKATSGSQLVNPTATTTYALDCSGAGGTVHKEASVNVKVATPPPGAPTLTFTASPTTINKGQSSTLTWSTTNATSCTASNGWTGSKAASGTQAVSPTATTTYALSCSGAGGTVSKSAVVNVIIPPVASQPGQFPEGMVTLSFDDSWLSQYVTALPVLQNAGLKGTFYLTTQPMQEAWPDFMSPAQAKDIALKGHEIADHTVTHPHLPQLSQAKINNEIKNSKTYLENLTGMSVTTIAYPYGELNNTVKNLVKQAGYTSARGTDDTTLTLTSTDKYDLKSQCYENTQTLASVKAEIDAAKANKQWFILCFHEIKTDTTDLNTITPSNFQQIVDYIKSTGIKVTTVKEGRALMAN
jgi:peptidoglycan/xylan/chitin deacetylase (PgdA/CDA1 family)